MSKSSFHPNNLHTFAELFLDLLFPRFSKDLSSFRGYLSQAEIAQLIPPQIEKDLEIHSHLNQLLAAGAYHQTVLEDLLPKAKSSHLWSISEDLAKLIHFQAKKYNWPAPNSVTFVPADPSRLAQRGFHLPQLLAEKLAGNFGVQCLDLVEKTKQTVRQTKLNRQERLTNLKGAFSLKPDSETLTLSGKIWLVDDVITTGSTMNEIAKVLKTQHLSLEIIAVAAAQS